MVGHKSHSKIDRASQIKLATNRCLKKVTLPQSNLWLVKLDIVNCFVNVSLGLTITVCQGFTCYFRDA